MRHGVIGVDWGSSNLRAFRFGEDGGVLETRQSDRGIIAVAAGEHERVLAALIGDWTDGNALIVCAGMVGSRGGWREVPYLPCPATLEDIAAAAVPVDSTLGRPFVLPGLRIDGDGADIMRGEETQIAGLADGEPMLVVAPGTHSKWCRSDGLRITTFRTFMTGELFAILRRHSLLGRVMADGRDDDAFLAGVDRTSGGAPLAGLLFGVRSAAMLGEFAPESLPDLLSGLLIGDEIESAAGLFGRDHAPVIVAGPALAARYALAFDRLGWRSGGVADGGAAVARGLWRAARHILETDR